MKKFFTLIAASLVVAGANAQETYQAATADGLAAEFKAVINENNVATNAADGKSIITINATDNIELVAVGGTMPASKEGTNTGDDVEADGTVNSWNDIKWEYKSQGDIPFYYVAGSGNPYVSLGVEEITTDGYSTGYYRATCEYYEPDGSKGMPITGLYYKFTPKKAGKLEVGIWANKGNRKTFIVDESTQQAFAEGTYTIEGYINGQNGFLSNEQIDSIHKGAMNEEITKVDTTATYTQEEKDSMISAIKDKYAYVIGRGNQAAWVTLTFNVEANKTYWLFQHSSQVGFAGYTFTPSDDDAAVKEISSAAIEDKTLYNLAGQKVAADFKGIAIRNGKKVILK